MTKTLTNHDMPTAWWETQFSRDELRRLAAAHGIKRGRDKLDASINLKKGKRLDGTIATFTVFCKIPSLQNCGADWTPCSASSIRDKVETERWLFIADWCKKKGISPMNADNFDRAAMEWAKLNCFPPNVWVLSDKPLLDIYKHQHETSTHQTNTVP